MRRVHRSPSLRGWRSSSSHGWRTLPATAALGAAIALVGSVGQHRPAGALAASVVVSAALFALVTAIALLLARTSRLVVDGAHIEHRQLGPTRRVTVGPGWRLIEYRRGVGRQMRWLWALFDPDDVPRLILNGTMWPRATLEAALAGTGVALSSARDRAMRDLPLDELAREQLEAFGEASDEVLGERLLDASVPPMPTRAVAEG
ncbi:MAG: hypothetical protein QM635_10010 [Microbacteriaceae bacterium]